MRKVVRDVVVDKGTCYLVLWACSSTGLTPDRITTSMLCYLPDF